MSRIFYGPVWSIQCTVWMLWKRSQEEMKQFIDSLLHRREQLKEASEDLRSAIENEEVNNTVSNWSK